MTLLVRADDTVLPPYLFFMDKPRGDVKKEAQSYVPHHVATCIRASVQENA
ncbi:hypothetical protein PF003_g32345 [Phytophthora fragariae]|nr:hypothetical protein PF003_g32345 [Phytophthora fragariae]